MRLLLSVTLALLVHGTAIARCAPFDFYRSLNRMAAIVHGKVTASNKDELRSASCSPAVCRHRLTVEVVEQLKGKPVPARLQLEYDYVAQRPEIALFASGDEFVFALRKVDAQGHATLLGTTCGRAGVPAAELDKVKAALRK